MVSFEGTASGDALHGGSGTPCANLTGIWAATGSSRGLRHWTDGPRT